MGTSSVVRQFRICLPLAAVLVVFLPAVTAAQGPVKSFDQLNTRLKVGYTVTVTDAQGREATGRITELHTASITLSSDVPTTFRAENVRLVERRTKPVGRAALWGLMAGAVGGLVTGKAVTSGDEMLVGAVIAAAVGIGAGVGALIGAAVGSFQPANRREIYRAPGGKQAHLSIAPVITPRTKGVAVAFSF